MEAKTLRVMVIIPAYKPGEKFKCLIERLKNQTYPIERILVINTEETWWRQDYVEDREKLEVFHISKKEFDHGGTRDKGARMADSDILLFFTQDAVPADEKTVEKLVEPFRDKQVAAVYGRQLPDRDCSFLERYTRSFNYPAVSRRKTKEDLPVLGIKTFFCSNVCAAYRREVYRELGGFVSPAIFNEDMIMAGKMIKAGWAVFYAADAKVIHSHNYTWRQQFRRNFDLAVSQADNPEVFGDVSSESEGIKLVKKTAAYVLKKGRPWLLISLVGNSGFKFLGYRFGKAYRRLPKAWIKKFTMNPSYWEKEKF